MKKKSKVLSALIAGIASLTMSSPASAHGFGWSERPLTDNNDVTFASDEDWDWDHNYFNHFVHFQQYEQYGPRTDLNVFELPRKAWLNDTDVVWFASGLPTGVLGTTRCRNVVWHNGRCDRATVEFQQSLLNRMSSDAGFWLACHEFGHAYSFGHLDSAEGGCMQSSRNPGTSGTPNGVLNGHMINHINGSY